MKKDINNKIVEYFKQPDNFFRKINKYKYYSYNSQYFYTYDELRKPYGNINDENFEFGFDTNDFRILVSVNENKRNYSFLSPLEDLGFITDSFSTMSIHIYFHYNFLRYPTEIFYINKSLDKETPNIFYLTDGIFELFDIIDKALDYYYYEQKTFNKNKLEMMSNICKNNLGFNLKNYEECGLNNI